MKHGIADIDRRRCWIGSLCAGIELVKRYAGAERIPTCGVTRTPSSDLHRETGFALVVHLSEGTTATFRDAPRGEIRMEGRTRM